MFSHFTTYISSAFNHNAGMAQEAQQKKTHQVLLASSYIWLQLSLCTYAKKKHCWLRERLQKNTSFPSWVFRNDVSVFTTQSFSFFSRNIDLQICLRNKNCIVPNVSTAFCTYLLATTQWQSGYSKPGFQVPKVWWRKRLKAIQTRLFLFLCQIFAIIDAIYKWNSLKFWQKLKKILFQHAFFNQFFG